MKNSGTDKYIRQFAAQNVGLVGVSAGAVILGPHIKVVHHFTPELNVVNKKDFSALGLINGYTRISSL